jgi:hypothetical protein
MIGLLRRLYAMLTPAGLVLSLVACAEDSTFVNSDPAPNDVATNVVERMRQLSSYHLDKRAPDNSGTEESISDWEIDYVDPHVYRVVSEVAGDNWSEFCDVWQDEPEGKRCRETVAGFSGTALGDAIQSGNLQFVRLCSSEATDLCTPWIRRLEDELLAGTGWLVHPEGALVAIELAKNLEYVGSEDTPVLHLRGEIDPIATRLETAKYVSGSVPSSDARYVECGGSVSVTGDEKVDESEASCTVQPSQPDEEAGDQSAESDRTVTIDLWISRDRMLLQRVVFTEEIPSISFVETRELKYSEFDEALVEVPDLQASPANP